MRISAVLCGILLFSAHSELFAREITGTVQAVSGKVATVVTDGDVVPATGDRARIFFKIAGSDDEISVATGKVIGRIETTIRVQIENATGTVAKNQLVLFTPGGGVEKNNAQRPETPGSPPPRPSPLVALRDDFAGRWQVQDENASYVLTLEKKGGRVTGTYNLQGGSLEGVIRLGRLHATWKQPGNRRGGSVFLRLSSDGDTLTGSWEYDPAIFSSGLQGSGTWTFKRLRGSR